MHSIYKPLFFLVIDFAFLILIMIKVVYLLYIMKLALLLFNLLLLL